MIKMKTYRINVRKIFKSRVSKKILNVYLSANSKTFAITKLRKNYPENKYSIVSIVKFKTKREYLSDLDKKLPKG